MGLAQIELAFDPASGLVLELAVSKERVDVLAFSRDQRQFDVVVQLIVLPVRGTPAARSVGMPEPVLMARPQRLDDVI